VIIPIINTAVSPTAFLLKVKPPFQLRDFRIEIACVYMVLFCTRGHIVSFPMEDKYARAILARGFEVSKKAPFVTERRYLNVGSDYSVYT